MRKRTTSIFVQTGRFSLHSFLYVLLLLVYLAPGGNAEAKTKELRVLLVTGGCCHNYPLQTRILQDALGRQRKVSWTVINEGGTGTSAMISLYDNANWAKGFDVVVHNECFADTKDETYIKKITKVHYAGVPAVVIHCAMHTYRSAAANDWREFLGVSTYRHDHQSMYPVTKTDPGHPLMKDFPDNWTSPKDELYIIEKTGPDTKVLATSVSERDGKSYPVIWTNTYGKAKVFGTSFGHSDDTFNDKVFTHLLANGILWAAGK